MYHASTARIEKFAATGDICLAYSTDEAAPYLNGQGGWMHTVEAPTVRLASEDEIREAAEAVGIDGSYIFELADDKRVRAALAADGFGGCEYDDIGPDNAYEHRTVRIWDTAGIVVMAIEAI